MPLVFYILRSKAHFSYHASTIEALIKRGATVRIFFDERFDAQSSLDLTAFEQWVRAHPTVQYGYFPRSTDTLRKPLMFFRELRSYGNYCTRPDEFEFYKNRWSHYLKLPQVFRRWLDSPLGRSLAGSIAVRKMTAAIERRSPAAANIKDWLSREKPALIVASPVNLRYSGEIEIVKAAQALGIKTVIPVLSWDNTSTKGLFHIQPDLLLAWNDGHKEEATRYHNIEPRRIRITGAPFFDRWFDVQEQPTARKTFCAQVGLRPERQFILYLGSSANIAKDETWFVRELQAALATHADPRLRDMQILFRPHPANWEPGLSLLNDGIAMWPRQGTLPDSKATFSDFMNCMHHADCVVGINTSGMLDAIIYGKPVISPIIDRYQYTQDKTQHFERIREAKAMYLAQGAAGVADCVAELLDGRDPLADNRRAFVKRFIWPRNKSGGEAQADEIAALLAAADAGFADHVRTERANNRVKLLIGDYVRGAAPAPSPTANIDVEFHEVFSSFHQRLEALRQSAHYKFYLETRDIVLRMMETEVDKPSAYWCEEVLGFDYLFDASPLVVSKIREHCYHVTGERSYTYRQHHAHKAPRLLERLIELQAVDRLNLFVPESPLLGGFGHESPSGLINVDTLKFYEVMIGLDRSSLLEPSHRAPASRHATLEIGAGWGGFAYQIKVLFPNTTYFIIDLAATMLFSTTYLRGVFPDARITILNADNVEDIYRNWQTYDFVFVPSHKLARFKPPQLDLAVNMVSFQEMTTAQVQGYVHQLADLGCTHLYSLNRDVSINNPEITSVSTILNERYDLTPVFVLDTDYTAATVDKKKASVSKPTAYRHYAGRLRTSQPRVTHGDTSRGQARDAALPAAQ